MTEQTQPVVANPDDIPETTLAPKPPPPATFPSESVCDDRFAYALQLLSFAEGLDLDGRRYTTVPERVSIFRRAFGPLSVVAAEITHVDNDVVRARAELHIPYGDLRLLVAVGHAEEWRDAHEVNNVAALENAETSAIGRALSAFGLGGSEFATAHEVLLAKEAAANQKKAEATGFLTSEEIKASVDAINGCTSIDQLAETFLKLNPALKTACTAAKNAKQRALTPAPADKPEAEKAEPAKPTRAKKAA